MNELCMLSRSKHNLHQRGLLNCHLRSLRGWMAKHHLSWTMVLAQPSCSSHTPHANALCINEKQEDGDGRVTAKFEDLSPVTCSEGDGDDGDDDDGDYDFAPAA
ncbi:hypothetical protein FF1_031613 [Malus domestica]